ncbi:MAG: hypothetical protein CM15mP55_3020 [Hyphomicrobiales bacterium]|nr:MAG: hypothetical protein CM15mP55_3020 [Hyphomicrobiales bacterium]
MDFEIPEDIKTYLAELDAFIAREIKPLEEQDDNIRFLTTGANMLAPIGTMMANPAMNGRNCWAKCAAVPTRPDICALPCRKNMADRTAPIWQWRLFVSTSPKRGLGLHNDLQMKARLSAISLKS